MKRICIALLGMFSGCFASLAAAAPITYEFESVTGLTMHSTTPSINGVLRNTTAPFVISFNDYGSEQYQFILNRCVPLILIMMEKPGRYNLNITIDPALANFQLVACGLGLR